MFRVLSASYLGLGGCCSSSNIGYIDNNGGRFFRYVFERAEMSKAKDVKSVLTLWQLQALIRALQGKPISLNAAEREEHTALLMLLIDADNEL